VQRVNHSLFKQRYGVIVWKYFDGPLNLDGTLISTMSFVRYVNKARIVAAVRANLDREGGRDLLLMVR